MTKYECVEIFNKMCNNVPVSFDKLLNMVSDYLTDNNIKHSEKLIQFIINNPDLIQFTFPKIIDYFCRKYYIFSLIYNNKTILYYVTN